MTRWMIYVCPTCGQRDEYGISGRVPKHNRCPSCDTNTIESIEVVPASFTDSDVERVAEAIYDTEEPATTWAAAIKFGWTDVEECRNKARAALSAYLEPTTKGDT